MAASYRALEPEHRELLVAMLDAPPGPVAERDLAAALRRHATSGLPKAPAELVDRLTDHFLRVTRMRVDWVHPSWRDLVIDELADDPAARRRFLSRCGVDGAALALSGGGGADGRARAAAAARRRRLGRARRRPAPPLRRARRGRRGAAAAACSPTAGDGAEVRALAALVLERLGWGGKALSVDAIGAWLALAPRVDPRPEPPAVAMTWLELEPAVAPRTPEEMERMADWVQLAGLLGEHDPELLASSASRGATATCCTTSRRTRRATSRCSSASCGSRRSRGSPRSTRCSSGQALETSRWRCATRRWSRDRGAAAGDRVPGRARPARLLRAAPRGGPCPSAVFGQLRPRSRRRAGTCTARCRP